MRPHLCDLPPVGWPPGFHLRCWQPGDECAWLRIVTAAGLRGGAGEGLFAQKFGDDAARLAARQLYLLAPAGELIGTVTAWCDGGPPETTWGRIHYLAIEPAWQGRGLARPLLGAGLARLAALGHVRAYLISEAFRTRALRLYLDLGFQPDFSDAGARDAWREAQALGCPVEVG